MNNKIDEAVAYFDITRFNELQDYFIKTEDWDDFEQAVCLYMEQRGYELVDNECKAPYPVCGIGVEGRHNENLCVYFDTYDSDDSPDMIVKKITDFACSFEDALKFDKFAVPEVKGGVAFIDGELFVKCSDRNALLSIICIEYNMEKTVDIIKN